VSSILDRLREVEGTTFPKEAGSGARRDVAQASRLHLHQPFVVSEGAPFTTKSTKHTKPQRGQKRNSAPNGRPSGRSRGITVLYRLFAGVLVLLVVLMVWRPWSSQPLAGREGRGLTPAPSPPTPTRRSGDQGSGGIVHESPPAAGAKELSPPPIARADAQPQVEGPVAGDQGSGGTVPEAPPAVAPPVADDAPTKAFLRTLTVTGIYQDAGGYIAFINGRAFQEGDKIEQVEIAEITSGRIAFAHKGKRYILHLR